MKNLIFSIFKPLLTWLNSVYNNLQELSVPVSRPLRLDNYIGVFGYLGKGWTVFITTAFLMAFIYMVTYVVVAQQGMLIKFKNTIKWW